MLNFFLVSAARHMLTDNDKCTTCRSKFKAPSLKNKYKNWKTFRKHAFHFQLITVWRFQTKKNSSLGMEDRTKEPQDPKGKNWIWTKYSGRKKLKQNWKKAIRFKLLEFCKTGTKKSSPDLFNFYVDLAGNDMVNDAGQTTTCRRKFTAHDYKQKYKKWMTFRKWVSGKNRLKIADGKKSFLA